MPTSEHPLSDSENTPILNNNTSRSELLKIARQYEAEKNTAQAEVNRLKRHLVDISNNESDDDSNTHGHHKQRRTRRALTPSDFQDTDDTISVTTAHEHFVYQAGHKFFLVYGPWIRAGEGLFNTPVDEDFNEAERFENNDNRDQGQLKEILSLLRQRLEDDVLQHRWFRRQFINGLNTQRYNTTHRLRHQCGSILGVNDTDLLSADVRKEKFRAEIGWVEDTRVYSSFDVPILHANWSGEYSLSSVFLNPKLMGLYIAIIRGPTSARHFMKGNSFQPQTGTVANIYGINHITPGAIATCAILARWVLSGDDIFQAIGSSTGIRYLNDFEEYLTILMTGLRQKKRSVINIIKQWDAKIFPDSSSQNLADPSAEDNGLKRAMQLLDEDSVDDEDVE